MRVNAMNISCVLCGAIISAPCVDAEALGRGERMLVKEAEVEGSPARVWAAWTDSTAMSRFFARESRIEMRIGGAYELYMHPDAPEGSRGCEGCTVLCFLPQRMLSFTWAAPPSIPGLRNKGVMTHVVVTMDGIGPETTRVRIAQIGFGEGEDWDKCYAYFDDAWPGVLASLRKNIRSIEPTQGTKPLDPRLVFHLEINASTRDVWDAFTTKKGVESWMVPLAEVDFRLNGTLKTSYDANGTIGDSSTITHRFMTYEPLRMLALQVTGCPAGFEHEQATKDTWAVLQLDPISPARTRLRLASAGLKSGPGVEKMIQFFEEGNAWTLRQLKKKLEGSGG